MNFFFLDASALAKRYSLEKFNTLPIDNNLITAAIPFVEKYFLNATDAVILRLALDLAAQLRSGESDLVLVASEQRLLKAAGVEGLLTFDPETQTEAALDVLLIP